jgi:hypothetical protein
MAKVRCDDCGKKTGSVEWRFTLDWRWQRIETAVHLCKTCWDNVRMTFGKEAEKT